VSVFYLTHETDLGEALKTMVEEREKDLPDFHSL